MVADKKLLGCLILSMFSMVLLLVEMMKPGVLLPRSSLSTREPCPRMSTKPCKAPKVVNPKAFSEDKKYISRKLLDIYISLKFSLAHKSPPTSAILLNLEGIIEQLDPTYRLSKTVEKTKEENNASVVLDVCPEEYRGEKYGYPFFHTGWVTTNCSNARPLSQVLTILLNTIEYSEKDDQQIGKILDGINNSYPGVHILLASKNKSQTKDFSKYRNVTIVNTSTKGRSLATVWNKLVSMVTTPYALIARDVVHFDFTARLERQIRMISDTDYVGVVGGTFRNLTGHWKVGCRQTKMMNYVLTFQEGYHHSRKSCMFCDDLEGPFVAETALLKSTKFNEKFPKEVIFEDFFIRVIRSGQLVMNCPDVMYYTMDYSTELKRTSKNVWQVFAREWVLVRIMLPGIKHAFSCQEISYKCSVSITKYATLPKCCLEQFATAMKFMQDFCMKNNVPFELDAGSNLAAVKFSNYNPFDLDGDISVSSWNYSFIKKSIPYFKTSGYPIGSFQDATFNKSRVLKTGYFMYYSPDIYTEAYGFPIMSADKYLPPELRDIKYFTKVRLDKHWINAMFSPGLYARNRYGVDVLKHSQSWLIVGDMGSSWSRYKPGRFLRCTTPKFHSCLDKFPVDGNIAFKVDD